METLSKDVVDTQAQRHTLLPATRFLAQQRWAESDKKVRVLLAVVKIWDEGGGQIDENVLANRFGIVCTEQELADIIDTLVGAGLLERLSDQKVRKGQSEEIGLSARGLNLGNELCWRRMEAQLNVDEW